MIHIDRKKQVFELTGSTNEKLTDIIFAITKLAETDSRMRGVSTYAAFKDLAANVMICGANAIRTEEADKKNAAE